MRNFRTEGIIIKRRNHKDSDRVLTVLTKTHGKIYVRATGVRKINSRRAGHIELLNHSMLTLYKGNSYPVLTEAVTIDNFSIIKNDLGRVGSAYHLCELVDGLCPENQENGQVFALLQETLNKLSRTVIPDLIGDPHMDSRFSGEARSSSARRGNDKLISEFEMRLLTILGYLPALSAGRQAARQGWNKSNFATAMDTENFIENILERRLKSRSIFAKLQ